MPCPGAMWTNPVPVSLVTNPGAGYSGEPLTHEEVLRAGLEAGQQHARAPLLGEHEVLDLDNAGHRVLGIAKEFQPNLFELLSTTKQTGMGLGLWLCAHIVTRQNGKIWYEDNEAGAKFIIELPEAT